MSLFLAPKFKRLTTIEEWPSAVEATKKNAALNKFSNIIAYEGKAEDIVSNLKQNFNTVILDPPRSGCDPKVIQQILEWKPEKVLYVACNPATLARDVALLHSGGYKLEKLQPFDMFPQTVQLVAQCFRCRGSRQSKRATTLNISGCFIKVVGK